uniref:Uncharacterized protein n=1 Tax=Pithovirus LCPAC403 TaxID=2506596 RepID=A0A481ZAX7_9VIRU|nr:MAG: hypothetical protein LCPAC403_02080 [Pithovirus LCPAC403]
MNKFTVVDGGNKCIDHRKEERYLCGVITEKTGKPCKHRFNKKGDRCIEHGGFRTKKNNGFICSAIIASGSNKGKKCTCSVDNKGNYCGRHGESAN